MAYKRSYRKKRGYKKRVRSNKTKQLVTGHGPTALESIASGIGNVATLARAVMPAIMAINTEAKFIDTAASSNITLAAPSIAPLCAMAQGLTESTRIGNSLLAKDLAIKFRFNTSSSGILNQCRVVIFVDKLQGGTAPTLAQIVQDTSSILSPFNKNYTDRFTIIKDQIWDLNQSYLAQPIIRTSKFYKKLDFHVRYLGTTSAAASLGPNQIYIMMWTTDAGVSATSGAYYARLNYTDN